MADNYRGSNDRLGSRTVEGFAFDEGRAGDRAIIERTIEFDSFNSNVEASQPELGIFEFNIGSANIDGGIFVKGGNLAKVVQVKTYEGDFPIIEDIDNVENDGGGIVSRFYAPSGLTGDARLNDGPDPSLPDVRFFPIGSLPNAIKQIDKYILVRISFLSGQAIYPGAQTGSAYNFKYKVEVTGDRYTITPVWDTQFLDIPVNTVENIRLEFFSDINGGRLNLQSSVYDSVKALYNGPNVAGSVLDPDELILFDVGRDIGLVADDIVLFRGVSIPSNKVLEKYINRDQGHLVANSFSFGTGIFATNPVIDINDLVYGIDESNGNELIPGLIASGATQNNPIVSIDMSNAVMYVHRYRFNLHMTVRMVVNGVTNEAKLTMD